MPRSVAGRHRVARPLHARLLRVILSMYGGGFMTVPAYLADMFSTPRWSAPSFGSSPPGRRQASPAQASSTTSANISSPRRSAGRVYSITMYILADLLLVGALCQLRWSSRSPKHHMSEEAAEEGRRRHPPALRLRRHGARRQWSTFLERCSRPGRSSGSRFAWGIWITLSKALVLFRWIHRRKRDERGGVGA